MKRSRTGLSTSAASRRSPLRLPLLAGVAAVAVTAGLAVAPLAPANAVATCLVAPPGIEAWWPGNGTAQDLVHGRDGVAENGVTYAVGKVGQAFVLDGEDDAVTVADDPVWSLGDADFSQVMWVKMDSVGRAVFTSHDEGSGSPYPKWMFYLDSGSLGFWVNWPYNWQPMVTADWAAAAGTWYQVAVTRSGDTWSLFVDGAQVGSAAADRTLPEIAAPVRLGYAEANESGVFALDGALDEVMFFHRALSASEVAAVYGAGATGLCAPVASSMTLSASGTSIPNGSSVTLSGELTLAGGVSEASRTIELDRAMGSNAPVTVATLTTDTGGGFSFVDKPPAGTAHYTARFEGADNAVPASASATVKVVVKDSALTLAVSDSRVTYGREVTLTAHLRGGTTNRTVAIYAEPVGGRRTLLARKVVSAKGNLSVKVTPRATTVYTATYAGEPAWTPSTSKPVKVTVAGRWSARSIGGYATSGGYRLYHWTSRCAKPTFEGCPTEQFTLAPRHAGESVVVTVQYRSGGRWHSSSWTWTLNDKSTIRMWTWYKDRDIIGIPHRFRMTFRGDGSHARAVSSWVYWKVTS
jgi:Concanavalin A-like lectin/glucanases superfamily